MSAEYASTLGLPHFTIGFSRNLNKSVEIFKQTDKSNVKAAIAITKPNRRQTAYMPAQNRQSSTNPCQKFGSTFFTLE
jgi:hypothetical protein